MAAGGHQHALGIVGRVFRRARNVAESVLRARSTDVVAPAEDPLVVPDLALVQELLDEFGLKHGIDGDGDLTLRWENCTMFVFFAGEHGELLRMRAYLDRWSDVDERANLTVLLDEWNRTRAMPKAFTILPDRGLVGICAENSYDFATGAPRSQIKFTLGFWVETLLHFVEWIGAEL